jgi:uncharacterized membrane protein
MSHKMIAAGFDSDTAAHNAAHDIEMLDKSGIIRILRAAMVTKDKDGGLHVPAQKDIGRSWGVLDGGLMGLLLGVLLTGPLGPGVAVGTVVGGAALGAVNRALSETPNLGLGSDFVQTVGSKIEPGQTVLLAELDEGSTQPLDDAVSRHGGRVYRSDIKD